MKINEIKKEATIWEKKAGIKYDKNLVFKEAT